MTTDVNLLAYFERTILSRKAWGNSPDDQAFEDAVSRGPSAKHIRPDGYDPQEALAKCKAGRKRMISEIRHALANKNYAEVMSLHGHAERWAVLTDIFTVDPQTPALPGLFVDAWDSGENHYHYEKLVRSLIRILSAPRLRRQLFRDEDWDDFENLPERITIYRGAKWFNLSGRSWTLDRTVAERFCRRQRYDPSLPDASWAAAVLERTVPKPSVLFYTDRRTEQEIVLRRHTGGAMSESDNAAMSLARAHFRGRSEMGADV